MLINLLVQQPRKKKRLLSPGQIAIFDHEIRILQHQKNMTQSPKEYQKPPETEKEPKWQQFALLALLFIFSSA